MIAISFALIAGMCFGAAATSVLYALDPRPCGDCAAWEQLAEIRANRTAELERQLDVLVTNEIERADEW